MVKINDVIDEINRLIIEKYPTFTAYIDDVPKNFERPSVLIEFVSGNSKRANYKTVNQVFYFTITYFSNLNNYHDADNHDADNLGLNDVLCGILEIFRTGIIGAGDRSINIKATTGGRNDNEIYIDLQTDFYDDVFDDEEVIATMKEIIIRRKGA